jgi:hypothetical protein
MPVLRILCYNGSLVIWTIISFTVAKFKPLSMSGFALSNAANIFHYHDFVWFDWLMVGRLVKSPSAQWFLASVSSRSMDKVFVLSDMNVFRIGPSSSMRERSVFLYRRYICCKSIFALSRRPCHYGLRFPVNNGLCSRLCLNSRNYSETAISQLNGRRFDRLQV